MASRSWLDLDTSGDDTFSDFEERTPPARPVAIHASPSTSNSMTTPQTTPLQAQHAHKPHQPHPQAQAHVPAHLQRTMHGHNHHQQQQPRQVYQPPTHSHHHHLQPSSPDSPQRALPRRAFASNTKFDRDLRGSALPASRRTRSVGGLPTSFRPPMQGRGNLNHMHQENLAAVQRLDFGTDNNNNDGDHNHTTNPTPDNNNSGGGGGDGHALKRTYSYPLPDKAPFCVWLGNLPAEAKPSHIVSFLEPIGVEPKDVRFGRIHKNKYTCAYVDFYSKEDMKKALERIDCTDAPEFMGRKLEIDINEGIVVDREAAVTCTSSSSSLNSPFRQNKGKRGIAHSVHHASASNEPDAHAQDIRFTASDDKAGGVAELNPGHSNSSSSSSANGGGGGAGGGYAGGDYYSDKREKYHRSKQFEHGHAENPSFRGRARAGTSGDRSSDGGAVNAGYWTGQWGQYRRKNGTYGGGGDGGGGNGFSPKMNGNVNGNVNGNSTTTAESTSIHKPHLQQHPQQQQNVAPSEIDNLTRNASTASSMASSIHDEVKARKSRFPTLDEDERATVVQDYLQHEKQYHEQAAHADSNGSNLKNYDMDTSSQHSGGGGYYDKKASYYNKSSKRRIDNNSFNAQAQQFPQQSGYKGKRHRNSHRADTYYSSKSSYKNSYRDERPSGGRRSTYSDSRSAGSYRGGGGGGGGASGGGGRYSKKRHGGSNSYAAY